MNQLKVLIVSLLTVIGVLKAPVLPRPNFPTQNNQPAPVTVSRQASSANISTNWSGYSASGGKFTQVTSTWNVPVINPDLGSGADATWVGIGGSESEDLIQAGVLGSLDQSGNPTYTAFFETLPNTAEQLNLKISALDSISATLNLQKNGDWAITINNNSTGEKFEKTVSYTSSLSSAEWIEEAPSDLRSVLPLDDFGTINFKNSTTVMNGKTLTLTQAQATPIVMINNFHQTLASNSPIGADGKSFSVTRTNGASTQNEIFQGRRALRHFYHRSFTN